MAYISFVLFPVNGYGVCNSMLSNSSYSIVELELIAIVSQYSYAIKYKVLSNTSGYSNAMAQ